MVKVYPEADLVKGCKDGKANYQHALYQQFYRKMYGVCLRYTANRDDALDMLQEGFIKVFRHITSFKGSGSLEGWVRRIMVHTCLELHRKQSRYFMVDVSEAGQMQEDLDALSTLSQEEILKLVSSLPDGYRTVFNLYVIEGYSHQEIAGLLQISEGTSKSQLSRAKALLKRGLEQLGVTGAFNGSQS